MHMLQRQHHAPDVEARHTLQHAPRPHHLTSCWHTHQLLLLLLLVVVVLVVVVAVLLLLWLLLQLGGRHAWLRLLLWLQLLH
jgi:hypothetical protein